MVQETQRLSGAEGLERLNQWIIEPEDHFNTQGIGIIAGSIGGIERGYLALPS